MTVNTEMGTGEDSATHSPLCPPSGVFLNVGIVGAGIAGLAAAAALSRIGHNVEVITSLYAMNYSPTFSIIERLIFNIVI